MFSQIVISELSPGFNDVLKKKTAHETHKRTRIFFSIVEKDLISFRVFHGQIFITYGWRITVSMISVAEPYPSAFGELTMTHSTSRQGGR